MYPLQHFFLARKKCEIHAKNIHTDNGALNRSLELSSPQRLVFGTDNPLGDVSSGRGLPERIY